MGDAFSSGRVIRVMDNEGDQNEIARKTDCIKLKYRNLRINQSNTDGQHAYRRIWTLFTIGNRSI